MKYDYKRLYEKNYRFYTDHPRLKQAILLINHGLTVIFSLAYILLWITALFIDDWSANELVILLFPPLLCFLIATVLRLFVHRARPYTEQGANITPLVRKARRDNCSFPSRHLACAAVIATVALYFSSLLGIVLYAVALGLAYIRFALGLHYPSDLLAGLSLGVFIGLLAFLL